VPSRIGISIPERSAIFRQQPRRRRHRLRVTC
jgi:hypothetical protein